ncbi:MAG: nucleotidyltransferase domain-containing protein [Deltaproteobacteria bacterium]|jgi:predicted nucleotidyltransferase|nr:nucleotidyltransferase domain-containing protein [Deltaproteobacteria bacterium]
MTVNRRFLFGSYAKGTADEFSDIYIALFFSGLTEENEYQIVRRLMHMTYNFKAFF